GSHPQSDRLLQLLPHRLLETHRPLLGRLEGLRLPHRNGLPRRPRRLPRRRGADQVRRPRGRRLEDEPSHRARSNLEGACLASSCASRTSLTSNRVYTAAAAKPPRPPCRHRKRRLRLRIAALTGKL